MPVVPIRPQLATPEVRPPPPPIFQLMAAATMAKEGKISTDPNQPTPKGPASVG